MPGTTHATTLTVLLFGPLAKAAEARSLRITLDQAPTAAALRAKLDADYPALRPLLGKCRFAVNQAFVEDDHLLQPSDEIALIGMVSGGITGSER